MEDKNWGAQWGFTDKDYIEELGLDPALEGKPEINKAIQMEVEKQIVRDLVQNHNVNEVRAQKIAAKQVRRKK